MVGSLLSAALVICIYMVFVGYVSMNKDSQRWKTGNMNPLILLAPILFLVKRQASESDQRRDSERINGKRMFGAGLGCGIVTLVVAVLMPQLPVAVVVFVVAWGTFLYTVFALLKGW